MSPKYILKKKTDSKNVLYFSINCKNEKKNAFGCIGKKDE